MKKTLNVGCGDRVFDEYPLGYKCINLDNRPNLNSVDIICDVRDLSNIDTGEFDYILASDIIEHFPISETVTIIRGWMRVLNDSGIIEFRLPNIEAICNDYINRIEENRSDMEGVPITHYFSWLLYGGQDYPGNFHFVGFDRRFFKYIITEAGLEEISFEKEGYNMVVKCGKKL